MQRTAIIIGAGVVGMASAYALARRDWHVTLIDAASGPAMRASHANGAQLSYCYTDALGSPSVLASMPRLLFGDGGVSFALSLKPEYLRWQLEFVRNCTSARFRKNTLAVLDLAAQSRAAMDELRAKHEFDFAHRTAGKLHLLFSEKDRAHAAHVCALKQAQGCEQAIVPRGDLTALDPAFDGLDSEVIGAVSTPSEIVADPLLFSADLCRILKQDYGADARFDCPVKSIADDGARARVLLADGEDISADRVIVAGGVESNRLLSPLGHRVQVQAMKGYSFEMPITAGSPRMSVTDGKRRLVFTNLGDRMRVAGIAELGDNSRTIDPARIEWLAHAAAQSMPDGGDYSAIRNHWAGLRPVTPNSQPIIRRASENIAINTGHGSLGWTLAMGSGERLAQLLSE